jgi:1,4-alpha-glucan branching enzyme
VSSTGQDGFGFDVVQHDALRIAICSAIDQCSYGATASVNLDAVAAALVPSGMDHAWRAVTCIENHDIVKQGNEQRIPRIADGSNQAMVNHMPFTQDLIRLRWRQPALRSDAVRAFHVHNTNRVIAYHRWIEGQGRDVIVVASLNDNTWWSYNIGFPGGGHWLEVFNSDVYDNWVNPIVAEERSMPTVVRHTASRHRRIS